MGLRNVMVVTGEASGDGHAADLVGELLRRDPSLRFFGMGGSKLAALGVDLVHGAHEVSVMGLVEVLPKVRRILHVLDRLEAVARRRRPKLAILVDIPDFNLRLARRLKAMGIPVAYYISPTVWAWRQGRVKAIARDVDRMLCILPFEEDFYRQRGVAARYVGSPVVEQVPPPAPMAQFRAQLGLAPDRPVLALLPGSRMGELTRILPTLVEAARLLLRERPELQLVVPVAHTLSREVVAAPFGELKPILIDGRAAEVVGASDVAVVASGTATLEAALMQRPMIVVYRMSPLTFAIGRRLVKLEHVSLPNLLLGRRVVPELLQEAFTPQAVAAEVRRLWSPGLDQQTMLAGLAEVRARIGEKGASGRAADSVQELLQKS
ncbi:MAG: lipid-A-disaccharide synthase [Myxococcota bacterium]|nr:lipid-A-disaccharide synthase [Myxococcota bacterium]